MPNGSDRPPAYWREQRCVEKKLAHGDTPDPCMPPCRPGTSKFSDVAAGLAGPSIRANSSDLRAVRHAELAHDLPDMSFDRTFPHPQPTCNNLVRVASSQEFEHRPLPRCYTAISPRVLQIFCSAVVPIRVASARLLPRCWTAISRCVFQIFCSAVVPVHDTRRGGDAIDRRMPLRRISVFWPHRRRKI
jgi:hypothetical protein